MDWTYTTIFILKESEFVQEHSTCQNTSSLGVWGLVESLTFNSPVGLFWSAEMKELTAVLPDHFPSACQSRGTWISSWVHEVRDREKLKQLIGPVGGKSEMHL